MHFWPPLLLASAGGLSEVPTAELAADAPFSQGRASRRGHGKCPAYLGLARGCANYAIIKTTPRKKALKATGKQGVKQQKTPAIIQQKQENIDQFQKWKHLTSLQHIQNQIKANRRTKPKQIIKEKYTQEHKQLKILKPCTPEENTNNKKSKRKDTG